jgi:hypothetical protein
MSTSERALNFTLFVLRRGQRILTKKWISLSYIWKGRQERALHCVTQASLSSPTIALSLLLHYGALLKFLSDLNSRLLFLVRSRLHAWPSLFSQRQGAHFFAFASSFPLLGTSGSIIPGLLERGSLSCTIPADVQFAHSHQHSFFSLSVSYSTFWHECVLMTVWNTNGWKLGLRNVDFQM